MLTLQLLENAHFLNVRFDVRIYLEGDLSLRRDLDALVNLAVSALVQLFKQRVGVPQLLRQLNHFALLDLFII